MKVPELTAVHHAIANAHGIDLYRRYSETSAADLLEYSSASLRRLRAQGRIGCLKLSPRKVRYFGYHLIEFLLHSVESSSCHDTMSEEPTKLETTGSHKSPEVLHGTGHGMTAKPDRRAALASAQRILKTPRKN